MLYVQIWYTNYRKPPQNNIYIFKTFSYIFGFAGLEKASTADGAELSSTANNNTENTFVSRGNGNARLSCKGHNIQCYQTATGSASLLFDLETFCDPVLDAKAASLAFNLTTASHKFRR